ncbi:hypothetical protein OIU84_028993 [Salix udensis]|uniref:Uncharacterized protein n=1 Tax=Salix udensis TaxID=889485 RepID=A0AAD6KDV0_9ROSI|nr:hypothetical protein OIU84_028993 [Salix udensis]
MLPFLAHGHLIPFIALARQIHQATGFRISIASTPLNIQYLSSTFNSSSDEPENDYITLLELPFCSADNGLPPNTESTENLSLDAIGNFLSASQSLRAPFHSLVSDISAKQGGAYGTLAYSSIWLNLPHRVEEFEPAGLEWLRNFLKLPVWAIGPLLPPTVLKKDSSSSSAVASGLSTRRAGKRLEIPVEKCMEWLESHSPASVLYISFGSQNSISPSQMMGVSYWPRRECEAFHLGHQASCWV